MVELTETPPPILLASHLAGERPILIYRVASLAEATAELAGRGSEAELTVEIPVGPCSVFGVPGGQRFAIYERSRPEVVEHFAGRRDF